MKQLYSVIGKTNSEREALEKKIARLESLNRTASKARPSVDPTVNALQDARRGHDEAMAMLMKDKEKALKDLQEEKDEVIRLQDLQEANYKAAQRVKEQISGLERERDTAKGEVNVAGKAAERSLREKEKEVLRWEKKFAGLEGELASVRKKVRSKRRRLARGAKDEGWHEQRSDEALRRTTAAARRCRFLVASTVLTP